MNNLAAFRFAAPIDNKFRTLISRVDYNLTSSGNHKVFGRFGSRTTGSMTRLSSPASRRGVSGYSNNYGLAIGSDAVLSPTRTNSLRYGVTKIDEANRGVTNGNYVTFRFIDPFDGVGAPGTFTDTRQPTHAQPG